MAYWLVTGGAGFVGSAFVRMALRQTEYTIVVVDKLTYASSLDAIPLDSDRLAFARIDLTNAEALSEIFQRYDFESIIHCAAESHVDNSISEAKEFIQTNIVGTYHLLEQARQQWQNNMSQHKFLHVSTDEVYGSLEPGEPATENTLYSPGNPYSATKAASDHLVSAWGNTFDLPYIITHSSNNYGAWQNVEKLIPKIVEKAYLSEPIPIYGEGSQSRDWLHVDDHCEALLALLKAEHRHSIYNITANETIKNLDLVNLICQQVDEYLGRTEGTAKSLIEFVSDRLGHDNNYAMSSDKLEKDTGWVPHHILTTSLMNVVAWYCDRLNEKHYVRAVS